MSTNQKRANEGVRRVIGVITTIDTSIEDSQSFAQERLQQMPAITINADQYPESQGSLTILDVEEQGFRVNTRPNIATLTSQGEKSNNGLWTTSDILEASREHPPVDEGSYIGGLIPVQGLISVTDAEVNLGGTLVSFKLSFYGQETCMLHEAELRM